MPPFKTFLNDSKPRLYHGSRKRFHDGFILTPQNDGYTSYPEVQIHEALLEKYRPKNKLSRKNAIFMVDDIDLIDYAGGYLDYVYLVEPLGKVEKHDMAWATEADGWDEGTNPELLQIIANYWNGVPYKNSENSLFEYMAPRAKILELVHEE